MFDAFTVAFGIVLLAELSDKSQLMALAFAARYPVWSVLLGVTLATLLINGASVLLGATVARALPTSAIQVIAGLVFLVFAAWTLRGEDEDHDEADGRPPLARWAFITVAAAFLLAELGDKTMLATITLATTNDPAGTWLGATAGMVAINGVAIAIGAALGARLPARAIRWFAAAAFLVFGMLLIAEGLGIL